MAQLLTRASLIQQLETDATLRGIILNFNKRINALHNSYSTSRADFVNVYNEFTALPHAAILFIINVSKSNISNTYLFTYTQMAAVDHLYAQLRQNYDNGAFDTPLLSSLNIATAADLVSPAMLIKEKAARSEIKFNSSAKVLALDMFSFTLFENHILANKKLSGKDATRYIKLLPNPGKASEEHEIFALYTKLIWDNVNVKSLELSKTIREIHYTSSTVPSRPFINITSYTTKDDWQKPPYNTSVTFGWYYFKRLSKVANIPMRVISEDITEATLHQYISGVPKKAAMSSYDMIYAIDKIKLLHFAISVDTYNCPYYQIAIDQLLAEIQRPENYKLFLTESANSTAALMALQQTDKLFKQIKETND